MVLDRSTKDEIKILHPEEENATFILFLWLKRSIAFQIHVSDSHNEVFSDFVGNVQEVVNKKFLVFLRPNQDTYSTEDRNENKDIDWIVTLSTSSVILSLSEIRSGT